LVSKCDRLVHTMEAQSNTSVDTNDTTQITVF
jgi:hypothetical protein